MLQASCDNRRGSGSDFAQSGNFRSRVVRRILVFEQNGATCVQLSERPRKARKESQLTLFRAFVFGVATLVSAATLSAQEAKKQAAEPQTTSSGATTVTGTTPMRLNQTSEFTATATLSDSTREDTTLRATWLSSNTAVASVSPTGLVSANGFGMANITATYQNLTGTFIVTVARVTGQIVGNHPLIKLRDGSVQIKAPFTLLAPGPIDVTANVAGYLRYWRIAILLQSGAGCSGVLAMSKFVRSSELSAHWDLIPAGTYCINVVESDPPPPNPPGGTMGPYSWAGTVTYP
jgi:hypothetical protein